MRTDNKETHRRATPHQPYPDRWPGIAAIEVLLGRTAVAVTSADDRMIVQLSDGTAYAFSHDQDCSENVFIEDVIGDLSDLVGAPFTLAEEISSDDHPPPASADSYTWTFYKFATAKGYVTVRWLGESNGYYSEAVDFRREPNWTEEIPQVEIDAMLVAADLAESEGRQADAERWREEASQFTAAETHT